MQNSQPRTLEECEACIKKSFIEAGQAFKEIRDRELYPKIYGEGVGFDSYCKAVWPEYSRSQIYRWMDASDVALENIPILGQIGITSLSEIAILKTSEARKEVIKEVTAGGKKPTYKEVKEAVDNKIVNMTPMVGFINEAAKAAKKRVEKRQKAKEREPGMLEDAKEEEARRASLTPEDCANEVISYFWLISGKYDKWDTNLLIETVIGKLTANLGRKAG